MPSIRTDGVENDSTMTKLHSAKLGMDWISDFVYPGFSQIFDKISGIRTDIWAKYREFRRVSKAGYSLSDRFFVQISVSGRIFDQISGICSDIWQDIKLSDGYSVSGRFGRIFVQISGTRPDICQVQAFGWIFGNRSKICPYILYPFGYLARYQALGWIFGIRPKICSDIRPDI